MSLRARLLGAFAYVLLLAIVSFGVPLALSLSARVNAEIRTQAQAQADLVAATAGDLLTPVRHPALGALARTAGSSLGGRVLIVNRSGRVLVDSAGTTELGTSYQSRPEIRGALSGRQVQVQRASRTLGQEILATAVPIIHNGRTAGAVRVTQPIAAVHQSVVRVELAIALIGLVVLTLGLVAASLLAGQIGRPLRRLEVVARRVASGGLSARATVEGSTEQRSLSRSFNDMTDRIARLLSAQRDFVADASHQLRTPLTGLRLRLEEARALTTGTDATVELDAALAEVDRLSHTVDELLLVSRAGERPLTGATLSLSDLATEAIDRWRPQASARGISLVAQRDSAPGSVWAAGADLERALDALLENAILYSPSGSTVTIATRPGRIEVRDRGPGIPLSERELVFERFRRGSTGLAGADGHGLGLPIARELVREWGGEITIEDRDNGGTRAVLAIASTDQPGPRRGQDFART
jgi:two-component system, OmpR family, sensor kinase